MARKRRRTQRLKVVNPDCAGIDIGKDRHFVAVDPERCSEPVRSFDGFTRDLEAMAAWLSSCGVKKVAMESTSVYWIPVYEVLERAGFEVMLVPPRMTKQIAGRKSDVLDCQWIWQLQSYGLLRGAFRPGDAICPLRSYVRQAKRLIEDRSRYVQHMQKALTQMNVLLDSVLADITGQTGQKILRAIIACALGQKACRDDFSVLYKRVPRMFAELETGRADGRYPRLFRALTKANLLILDDWGPDRLSADQRRDLMEIVEDRYQNAAILITSQLPVDKWHDVIGEPTFADAILDRIVHNAHRINLDGPSMQKTIAENFNANDLDHAERK